MNDVLALSPTKSTRVTVEIKIRLEDREDISEDGWIAMLTEASMPTIDSIDPVFFSAVGTTAEHAAKDDLVEFHTKLLEDSSANAWSVRKATRENPVIVQVVENRRLTHGAAAMSVVEEFRNVIRINPSLEIEHPPLRTASSMLKNKARQSLIFGFANLAAARQHSALDELAESGHYELTAVRDSLPEIAKSLLRKHRLPAVRYAVDVEEQEWETVKQLNRIASEISHWPAKANLKDVIPVQSKFEDHLAVQIENGHTQAYLRQYHELRRQVPHRRPDEP